MRTSYLHRTALVAPTLFFGALSAACGVLPGDPTPGDTPTPAAEREHCGDVTGAEVWEAGLAPHVVTCDVNVLSGGSVTVEAGALVVVEGGGLQLWIEGGRLAVEGTAEAPVVFQAVQGEAWYGIHAEGGEAEVSLRYTTVADAIQQPGTIDRQSGPLVLNDAEALVDHLAIAGGSDCGLVMQGDGRLADGSVALSVSGVEDWPVCTSPVAAGSLPAEGADLTGNGTDAVNVTFEDGVLPTSSTWSDLGVPYVAQHPLFVRGTASNPAVLTLGPGVEVAFASGANLRIGRYDDHASGGLLLLGTEEAPVRLRGWEGASRGAWGGITSYTATPFELRYAVVDDAGGANGAALWMEGGEVLVDHAELNGSAGMGLSLIDDARFAEGSADLAVRDCAVLGRLYAEAVGSIPEAGIDLDENDTDFVTIEGKGGPALLDFSDTWGDIGVAYKIKGKFDLVGTASKPTILTLEPGVAVTFGPNAYLGVGGEGAAGLRAVGTEEAPITFRAADSLSMGAWAGIYFSADTLSESTELSHVEVGYAGADYFYRRQGAIIVDGAHVTIHDSWIHHSLCNGIAVYTPGSASTEAITYSDMGAGEGCQNETGAM